MTSEKKITKQLCSLVAKDPDFPHLDCSKCYFRSNFVIDELSGKILHVKCNHINPTFRIGYLGDLGFDLVDKDDNIIETKCSLCIRCHSIIYPSDKARNQNPDPKDIYRRVVYFERMMDKLRTKEIKKMTKKEKQLIKKLEKLVN